LVSLRDKGCFNFLSEEKIMAVEIICVIDRSGSMHAIKGDAIGGFNAFLKEQQDLPGEANITVALFDDKYDLLYDAIPIKDAEQLTDRTFVPRGSTALYDAIGKTVNQVGQRFDKSQEKPEKVIFVTLTDGHENASAEFTNKTIADMIKHQSEKYGWEFIYLGANQDAFAISSALNISAANTVNFAATGMGTRTAYADASNLTKSYRANI
jgi:uncharacterized protein YegL